MHPILWLVLLVVSGCGSSTSAPVPTAMDEATFERELERRFQYGPPVPVPEKVQDERKGQLADTAYFAAFPDYDRSFSPRARAGARRLAEQLRQEAGELAHEQFVLRVAEIAALADNGHTAIGRNAFMKNTPRLPLRTHLFADGLRVLRSTRAHADLLGARIEEIDGRTLADVYRVIRRFAGGVEARRWRQLVPMLESPALLEAAGVASERGALVLSGALATGERFERRIEAEERGRSAPASGTAR